jgi:hypothetical protein
MSPGQTLAVPPVVVIDPGAEGTAVEAVTWTGEDVTEPQELVTITV